MSSTRGYPGSKVKVSACRHGPLEDAAGPAASAARLGRASATAAAVGAGSCGGRLAPPQQHVRAVGCAAGRRLSPTTAWLDGVLGRALYFEQRVLTAHTAIVVHGLPGSARRHKYTSVIHDVKDVKCT